MTTCDDWYSDMGGAPVTKTRLTFQQEKRVQEAFTTAAERKALNCLAARLPSWVNSDHLTAIGSLGMLLAGASYAVTRWQSCGLLAATFFLALNWFGDSLDGTLARVRHCQRPRYGFYLDHLLDSLGALFLMAGLALSGYISPWIAIGMLIAFLLLSIEVYLTTYTMGSFRLSYGKLGPTELRIALAVANLALYFRGDARVLGGRFLLMDIGGLTGIAAMMIMLLVSAASHVRQLYREEPLP